MTGVASKDTTSPWVSVTAPANGAKGVAVNAAIGSTFNETVKI